MKKIICILLAVLMFGGAFAPVASARETGGLAGFIIGCCFGARNGAAWNDGKSLHWKDWGTIIPLAGIVIAIINGVDTMNGSTTSSLASQYGSQYY